MRDSRKDSIKVRLGTGQECRIYGFHQRTKEQWIDAMMDQDPDLLIEDAERIYEDFMKFQVREVN
jgi:hypothetical protein